ncbi:MAG: sugar phosphate isomerase/epimerase [Clostridia bacterium]|nr:sugar phosphate isomerase/epimerase [Clostridia bacterium]
MLRKKGIVCDCIAGANPIDTLEIIKEVGFDSFFTGVIEEEKVLEIVNRGKALGLECEFLHAPFTGINEMWKEGDGYLPIYEGMIKTINSASATGVKKVILHLSSGWNAPEITDLGQKRFDEIVTHATEKGVTVAFENLRVVGNVSYFADKYRHNDGVRFCYDCGHEHCYTKYVSFLDIFRERTIATHIHDNFGKSSEWEEKTDLHLLPYDGDIDYRKMMKKLDEYGYEGSLMLEVFNSSCPEYAKMTAREFIKSAYERLERILREN